MARMSRVAGLALALGTRAAEAHPEHCGQASYLTVEPSGLKLEVELSPGPAVASALVSHIDQGGDGKISESERQAYAREVMGQQELKLDGEVVGWRLAQIEAPEASLLATGQAKIRAVFVSSTPLSAGPHALDLTNRHEPVASSYMAHAFGNAGATVKRQSRDASMRNLRVDLLISGKTPAPASDQRALGASALAGALSLAWTARAARRRAGG